MKYSRCLSIFKVQENLPHLPTSANYHQDIILHIQVVHQWQVHLMHILIRDWLSDWKNLPEILLGYYQHYGGNNEYSYRNLFWRMDKICHSDKPHCTVTTCACGLYRNSMLCERLAGRTGILLKKYSL